MRKAIEEMKQLSIKECDKEQLVDLRSIEIDEAKSKEERILDYVRQVKNPLHQLSDGWNVIKTPNVHFLVE